ncbi:structure-specific endonuclease subunit SLX4 isoform X2 [Pararge aegeria]|uniref:structure-specific endonuclease subunit SLX4 isoform X2 n=1 Tax=Pararge aegeria TaxID=116150 RepID=UPI0019D0D743|nr:structure-specific endonuclease subunit SLX4 isoform X2 [Pararge aegeria]
MPNRVVSKYFPPETETGMDDSLSEFQEKKKFNNGPKNVKKTRITKKLKRTRGQKDIRALIKKQENDVFSYSKDFDKVCKQVGVDVDTEELQLAIALSKSLNKEVKEAGSESETLSAVQCLTSQQRTLRIKTTLQEYGFRVPKTKITDPNRKKKCCKQYKLLLISDAERQQIISDKYSEVLAGNIFKSPAKVLGCEYNDRELYYRTTNIPYEYIKSDDVYYVKDLFSKPDQKTCVLRDWSEIPGRPLSPTVEIKNVNFDDIICDQHELDCLLSGTILTAQKIIAKKTDISFNNYITIDNKVKIRQDEPEPLENKDRCKDNGESDIKLFKGSEFMNSNAMSQVRSVSPDLFDDEPFTVMECTDIDMHVSRQTVSMTENVVTYCMDLTECVNVDINTCIQTNQHTSNKINITNRKSNDFMEITKCVSTSLKQVSVERIDLTQNLNIPNNQSSNVLSQNENISIMDLTQVPDCQEKVWDSKKDNSFNDTIILVDDDINNFKLQPQKNNFAITEISEPICIDDMINCKENSDKRDCDDNLNLSTTDCKTKTNKQNFFKNSCESLVTFNDKTNFEKTSDKSKNDSGMEKEEDQLTDSSQNNWDSKRLSYRNEDRSGQPDEIDLTQDSNSSRGETDQPILNYTTSLGKIDNISIDYDEIHDDIANRSIEQETYMSNMHNVSKPIENSKVFKFSSSEYNCSLDQSKHDNFDLRDIKVRENENTLGEKEPNTSNNDIISNPSLEIFEISDKELNYSLYKSKHETYDLGGLPIISSFSDFASNSIMEDAHNNCGIINRALSEENVISPYTVTKSRKFNLSIETLTPTRLPNENINNVLQTPKNSDFIIKTNEVTPMLDYASMSSPERHKELEKYGLKPFKRKRAVQLLTYLYNQTHPLVESHDDCPSPSKRQKKEDKTLNSPTKSSAISPLDSISMTSKAPLKGSEPEINLANDLYAITNEQPDIRNIACEADEWVFQKREKAKLQSCRVPLHIAFHNYVTCRRRLREAILRYEPVNIDVIHKNLVATGYKYHPKDLLKFMDRKCITVRTADNNSRNRKS